MKISRYYIPFFIAILLLSSCVPHKRIIYLQEKTEGFNYSDTIPFQKTDYLIKPFDNLYIRVISLDEKTYSFFNMTSSQYQQNYLTNETSIYLNSYSVDEDGFIYLPYIGKLLIKGNTIKEAENIVQGKVDEYLKDATVILKLVNYNITILGEVNQPGKFSIYQNEINLFQALGMAGDLTERSNKYKVQLIRKYPKGSLIKEIDLTDKNIIHSEFYWLMPDDIIYVERLKSKSFVSEAFPYSLIFSTITTTLLILNYTK